MNRRIAGLLAAIIALGLTIYSFRSELRTYLFNLFYTPAGTIIDCGATEVQANQTFHSNCNPWDKPSLTFADGSNVTFSFWSQGIPPTCNQIPSPCEGNGAFISMDPIVATPVPPAPTDNSGPSDSYLGSFGSDSGGWFAGLGNSFVHVEPAKLHNPDGTTADMSCDIKVYEAGMLVNYGLENMPLSYLTDVNIGFSVGNTAVMTCTSGNITMRASTLIYRDLSGSDNGQ